MIAARLALAVALVAIAPLEATDFASTRAQIYRAFETGQLPDLDDPVATLPEPLRLDIARWASATGGPEALELLKELTKDPAAGVRREAMMGFGRMSETHADPIIKGLHSSFPSVRQAAAWAAGQHAEATFQATLARLEIERHPSVLEALLANLWRQPTGIWEHLVPRWVVDPDVGLRRALAFSIARSPQGVEPGLIAVMAHDEHSIVRATILGAGRRHDNDTLRRLVLDGTEDGRARVRAAAWGAIASYETLAVETPLRQSWLKEIDGDNAQAIAAALDAAAAHPSLAEPRPLHELAEKSGPALAAGAFKVLAATGDPKAKELISDALESERASRRIIGAEALVAFDTPPRGLVRRALKDPVAGVRASALELASPRQLRRALGDDDAVVRAVALSALLELEEIDEAALTELLSSWSRDDMADARLAAFAALLELGVSKDRALEAFGRANDTATLAALEVALGEKLPAAYGPRSPVHDLEWFAGLESWRQQPRSLIVHSESRQLTIELDTEAAAITSRTIWELAASGFYDGLLWHRVVPNFVVQGGDPRGDGWGGPGWVLPDEPGYAPFDRGSVGIATSGPGTGGSQIFITTMPADHLTGRYTNFGLVVEGREHLDEIGRFESIERIEVH